MFLTGIWLTKYADAVRIEQWGHMYYDLLGAWYMSMAEEMEDVRASPYGEELVEPSCIQNDKC